MNALKIKWSKIRVFVLKCPVGFILKLKTASSVVIRETGSADKEKRTKTRQAVQDR